MFPERSEAAGRGLPLPRTLPVLPEGRRRYDTKASPAWVPPQDINRGEFSREASARPRSLTRPSLRPPGESEPPWRSTIATATRYRPSAACERPPPQPASARGVGQLVSRRQAAPRIGVQRPPSLGPLLRARDPPRPSPIPKLGGWAENPGGRDGRERLGLAVGSGPRGWKA